MLKEIKKRLEKELVRYVSEIDEHFGLRNISPLLFSRIREFVLREGKRVRPTLFIIGYLGYCRRPAKGLYASALSLELLHDFMLVHDDIIDKSDLRRGKPSLHKLFETALKPHPEAKFNGQDLAIVAGDVMYAMALHTFLRIEEPAARKEAAFKKLIEAAMYTGSGEFIELMYGVRSLEQLSLEDIYRVYDYKTAYYTFAYPLTMGATLGGASPKEIGRLFKYGVYLGRAFQIKDDIIGLFSDEKEIGKSNLTDLQEAKNTALVWHAHAGGTARQRKQLKDILRKAHADRKDLELMQELIRATGSLEANKKEIALLIEKAQTIADRLTLSPRTKAFLRDYPREILSV
jgi:geranylgeranyl diphosphate synthase, type I